MRKTYEVDGHVFRTQKELVEKVKSILNQAPCRRLDKNEESFMIDLFVRYHWSWPVSDQPVVGVSVDRNEVLGFCDPAFFLLLQDGTRRQIGYRPCVSVRNTHRCAMAALRFAVMDDVRSFRNATLQTDRTDFMGRSLTECIPHVDHHPIPFRDIVAAFYSARSIVDEHVPVTERGPYTITDPNFEREWREFHRGLAAYRLLHPDTHKEVTLDERDM